MIQIRPSVVSELETFCRWEAEPDNARFVVPSDLSHHQHQFEQDGLFYLSVYHEELLVGFVLLAQQPGMTSVELRRVIVQPKGQGYGQRAMLLSEDYCRHHLNATRIWLDVYKDNPRGQHVYHKLGYRPFSTKIHQRRELMLMEKRL